MLEKDEIINIIVSIIVLGFIFTFRGFGNTQYLASHIVQNTIMVSLAFLIHELAHREVARKLGFFARYEMWGAGVLMSVLLSLVSNGSIGFASLGAVVIYPVADLWGRTKYPGKHDELLISSAGPISNIVLGMIGFILYYMRIPIPGIYEFIYLNIWLAFFNMLPIPPLDGFKVFRADWRIFLLIFLPVFVALLLL